jgi:hypothetical protein
VGNRRQHAAEIGTLDSKPVPICPRCKKPIRPGEPTEVVFVEPAPDARGDTVPVYVACYIGD